MIFWTVLVFDLNSCTWKKFKFYRQYRNIICWLKLIWIDSNWIIVFFLDVGLWGLVNNAGIAGIPVPYHWMEKREIQRVLDVNLMGTIEVTNEFFPLIRQAKGRIVNVSSGSAVMPMTIGGYSISKIGVEAFSDALRWVWGKYFVGRGQILWRLDWCYWSVYISVLLNCF